jgi:hypothetical protein
MNRAEAAVLARAAKAANAPSVSERFWSKVQVGTAGECWPWMAACRNANEGYGAFWLNGRHQPAPRVALMLTGTPVPTGMEVCHRCDNPPCCNPAHLFVGTRQDNNEDKVCKNRHAHGVTHGNALLTSADVDEIRRQVTLGAADRRSTRRDKPYSYRAIAERFGISEAHVGDIARGDTRKAG